jgi:hypothetical protein
VCVFEKPCHYLYVGHNASHYSSCSQPSPPPLHFLAKSSNSAHVHCIVGKCIPFRNIALSKLSAFTNHPKCASAEFEDFARQHNGGGGGCEKHVNCAIEPGLLFSR